MKKTEKVQRRKDKEEYLRQNNIPKTSWILDFDGVIADSFKIAFEVAKLCYPSLTLENYQKKFSGNILENLFTEPESGTPVDFQKEYALRMKNLEIASLTKYSIEALYRACYNLHIVSSTDTATIVEFCKRNGILDCFEDILGGDVDTSKVNKIKTIVDKYHLDPKKYESVVFISDTIGDFKEADQAGIAAIIGVVSEYQPFELVKDQYKDSGVYRVYKSLYEIQDLEFDDYLFY